MRKSKRKIFDVFLFFNELDLLELRLKTLNSVVDYFVITEVDETFSGKPKKLIFKQNMTRYKKYTKKIIYNPISKEQLKDLKTAKWSNYVSDLNNVLSHKHSGRPAKEIKRSLKREISHRDSAILGFFKKARPYDYILLSDLDEIPNPMAIKKTIKKSINVPHYFKMDWFLYWINNKVSEPWFGTVLFHFKDLKGNSLDNFRFASSDEKKVPGKIVKNGGWHFSYLGGIESVKRKLEAHPFQGYKALIAILLDKLKLRKFKNTIKNNKDILLQNRKFTLIKIDDSYPKALLKNKSFIEKYTSKDYSKSVD